MDPYAFLGRQAPARSSGTFGPTAQDIVENAPPASPDVPQSLNQTYFRPSDGKMITPGNGAEAAIRAFANGVTGHLANDDVAALHATFPALSSGSSNAADWADRYRENQQIQNTRSIADETAHPIATAVGSGLGWATGLLNPEATVWKAMGKGAGRGAIDGLGDALSKKENMDDGANSVVGGAVEGALSDTFGHWLHVHRP